MDERNRGTDIHALFSRLGMEATAYREFETPPPVAKASPSHGEAPARRSVAAEATVLPSPPSADQTAALRWSGLDALAGHEACSRSDGRAAALRVALWSHAGGAGRSVVAAGLARLFAGRGHHVVLGDACAVRATEFLLPASAPRFGRLAFLHVPVAGAPPISVLNLAGCGPALLPVADPAISALEQAAAAADLVLFDLPAGADFAAEGWLRSVDVVLVPLLPDIASVASVARILESFGTAHAACPKICFLMNRFDESRAFHRRVRAQVRRLAGHRLLDVCLCDEPLMSEAIADRLTILDYAPGAPGSGDLERLAAWVAEPGAQAMPRPSARLAEAVA